MLDMSSMTFCIPVYTEVYRNLSDFEAKKGRGNT